MPLQKTSKVFVIDLLCMTPFYDRYLVEALSKKIPAVILVAISFHLDPEYFEKYNIKRLKIVDIVSRLKIANQMLRQALKLPEYLANLSLLSFRMIYNRPAILHVQWISFIAETSLGLWSLKLAKAMGVKIVYTVHNVLPHDTGLTYKSIFKRTYQFMDALICHTSRAKNELITEFGISDKKIWVIPHGPMFNDRVNTSSTDARKLLSYREDQVVILCFGVIRPYKGIEFLLDALKIVIGKNKNTLLVIAGNGEAAYLDKIRKYISELNLNENVRQDFKYIPNNELPIYFQAADILVYPYKNVTQSGALLTGMAYGKPIVASSVGGLKETLLNGKIGLLVEYGNAKDLADALTTLINSPEERTRLGNAALSELEDKYSWDVIAEKTLECYKKTLAD
jgi:glycosyltransferase involved in cell wall biosynthesis